MTSKEFILNGSKTDLDMFINRLEDVDLIACEFTQEQAEQLKAMIQVMRLFKKSIEKMEG